MISHIRHSLTARITLWVVGFAAVIMVIILLMMRQLTHVEGSEGMDGSALLTTALLTAGASLIVLLLLCRQVVGHHLHPLDMLAGSAQRIADGKMEESVPDTGHEDEVGQLQNSFAKMQRALTDYITEMQRKRDVLNKQNEELEAAYAHAREADSIKTQFLSRMTEQMGQTVEDINQLTSQLCDHHDQMSVTELMKLHIEMLSKTDTVTHLLDKMISPPKEKPLAASC